MDAEGGAVVGGSACPPSPRPPKYLRTSSLEQHRKFYSGYKQTNQKTTYRVPPVVAVAHFANVFFLNVVVAICGTAMPQGLFDSLCRIGCRKKYCPVNSIYNARGRSFISPLL